MLKGIDISHWQSGIDYSTVKNNVDFVILKAGGSDDGFYEDSRFREHLAGFQSVGVPILGAYYYVGSKFLGDESGKADADRLCDILDGTGLRYAILDLESTDPDDKDEVTTAARAFMNRCLERGYGTMIYGSDISTFVEKVDSTRLSGYTKWVARYGSEPVYITDYAIWQYTSSGTVDGIAVNVDMDYLYDESLFGDSVSGDSTHTWNRETAVRVTRGLYSGVLRRGYCDGENDGLIDALTGDMTRVQTLNSIRESDEYRKKQLIIDCYRFMRGSDPSDEEISIWFDVSEDDIKQGILYSEEFNNRYGV